LGRYKTFEEFCAAIGMSAGEFTELQQKFLTARFVKGMSLAEAASQVGVPLVLADRIEASFLRQCRSFWWGGHDRGC